MGMFVLYADTCNHTMINPNEVDLSKYQGDYFEIYGFEGDNDNHFEETWYVDDSNMHIIKIIFNDPGEAIQARIEAEKKYKLLELIRVRVPEWFYKKYYE